MKTLLGSLKPWRVRRLTAMLRSKNLNAKIEKRWGKGRQYGKDEDRLNEDYGNGEPLPSRST